MFDWLTQQWNTPKKADKTAYRQPFSPCLWPSKGRWGWVMLLTLLLVVGDVHPASAQITLLFDQSVQATRESLGWNPNRSYACGRLVCSDVYLYGSFGKSFTLAGPPDVLQPNADQILVGVENRADLVQRTFKGLLDAVIALKQTQQTLDQTDVHWSDLFSKAQHNHRHPSVPKIEVGVENSQTVLFVPEQDNLNLQKQLVLTVNDYDAIQNGLNKEVLAEQWRQVLLDATSQQLKETAFTRRYPLARIGSAIAVVFITLCTIGVIDIVRRWLRNIYRRIRRELIALEQQLKASLATEPDAIAAELSSPPATDIPTTDIPATADTADATNPLHPQSNRSATQANPDIPSHPRPKPNRLARLASMSRLLAMPQTVSSQVNSLMVNLPKRFLNAQQRLKQQRNLVRSAVRLMFWGEVFMLFLGAGLGAFLYPATRPYAPYVFAQAVALPIIWIGVSVFDAIVDLEINYRLNQWIEDKQISNPLSNRYTLRMATYSASLRSASTLGFWILGGYLTIQTFGINPTVLASAGLIAAVIAFVSRSVLEDMINGTLILWNDRYAVGDVIQIGGAVGLVERMNLYMTEIRGAEGRLITIPNGQIKTIENLTKDWSRVDFTIEIAYDADIQHALQVIEYVAETLRQDPNWQDKILEPASILGVDRLSHTGILIQVWLKTQAMQQWAVGREFRLRVKQAFDQAGITIGLPQQAVWYRDGSTAER